MNAVSNQIPRRCFSSTARVDGASSLQWSRKVAGSPFCSTNIQKWLGITTSGLARRSQCRCFACVHIAKAPIDARNQNVWLHMNGRTWNCSGTIGGIAGVIDPDVVEVEHNTQGVRGKIAMVCVNGSDLDAVKRQICCLPQADGISWDRMFSFSNSFMHSMGPQNSVSLFRARMGKASVSM